jgi:hypothetical protein
VHPFRTGSIGSVRLLCRRIRLELREQ